MLRERSVYRAMKISVIRRRFSATGGAELYTQRFLSSLVEKKHEVHLFTESWDESIEGVSVHKIPVGGPRSMRPLVFAKHVKRAVGTESFDCIFSLERTIKQDVYRAGDGLHRVWLKRRREFTPLWKRLLVGWGSFHRAMLKLEARTFDPENTRHIIVNSEMVRREICEHFRFPANRIHLVRNGVDVGRFSNGNRYRTRERFGIGKDEFVLLFVGSGWERKGLKFVLSAIRRMPELKLLVVGKGRKPASAPINAIFAGPMDDVENAFAAADLLVMLPIYEPSANVVVEGLAAGLPVITSANNGAAEILEEGVTGRVLEDFWSPEQVADAIKFWVDKPVRTNVAASILSIDRNVYETLAILDLAFREKTSGRSR